jgi:hypothetical protein
MAVHAAMTRRLAMRSDSCAGERVRLRMCASVPSGRPRWRSSDRDMSSRVHASSIDPRTAPGHRGAASCDRRREQLVHLALPDADRTRTADDRRGSGSPRVAIRMCSRARARIRDGDHAAFDRPDRGAGGLHRSPARRARGNVDRHTAASIEWARWAGTGNDKKRLRCGDGFPREGARLIARVVGAAIEDRPLASVYAMTADFGKSNYPPDSAHNIFLGSSYQLARAKSSSVREAGCSDTDADATCASNTHRFSYPERSSSRSSRHDSIPPFICPARCRTIVVSSSGLVVGHRYDPAHGIHVSAVARDEEAGQ